MSSTDATDALGPTHQAEPGQAEPDAAEPNQAEPGQAEPAEAEPAGAEPAGAEPAEGGAGVPDDGEDQPHVRLGNLDLRGAVEAILLVADEPIPAVTLAQVLGRPQPEVEGALHGLATEYDEADRGFELRELAGGWRYYTRDTYAEVVERFVRDGQQARLTQAALETLAVVAYRQPVSRSRVSAIRGVNCDGVMKTLVARGLVEETGVEHETGATLFGTTSYFLERLGLSSVDELPELAPYLPEIEDVDILDSVLGHAEPDPAAPDTPAAEPGAPEAGAPDAPAPGAEAAGAEPGEPEGP